MAEKTELQILVKAKDEASKTLKGVEGRLKGMSTQLRIAGAAMTAVGVAGMKMIADAKKMNAQLGVTALGLGVTTKELRNLAIETGNVTFPLEEVIASFDLLARAGVKDAKVLREAATAFDTLGDATGYTASRVAEMMVPAMKTFGLSAEEMAEKIDMMTYMSRESTMSLEDFNTMVGYTTPELVAAGLSIEDLTAILIHMEKEGFAPGRVMTREFNKAVTEATELQIPLTEAIGITAEELIGYKEELSGATGMAEEFADVANTQYGILDKLKYKFTEVSLSVGSYIEPLEGVFAAMTALGPVMILISTQAGISAVRWAASTAALISHTVATTASTVAHWALNTAMLVISGQAALHAVRWGVATAALISHTVATAGATAAVWALNVAMLANPIGLIIAAVAALTAVVVVMAMNWKTITSDLIRWWNQLRDVAKGVFSAISGFIAGLISIVQALIDKILRLLALLRSLRRGGGGGAPGLPPGARVVPPGYTEAPIRPAPVGPRKVPYGYVEAYQRGGPVLATGLALVHKNEFILPANTLITIPVYLDGELIAEKVIRRIGDRARLQGAF